MEDFQKLKRIIEQISQGVVNNMTFTKKVHATLISVEPLQFQLDNLILDGSFLITPKYRVFRQDEIGHKFVFQEDNDGQQFIYCYEAAEPGQNGVPYRWTGSVICNLTGTCPDGTVTVTGGELTTVTHERGLP